MRRLNFDVFDDFVYGPADQNVAVFTDQAFNLRLAEFDQLGIEAVVDSVSAATSYLYVQIYHSADGIHWLAKNTLPEINGYSVPVGQTTPLAGADTGYLPSLGLVRLNITLFNASTLTSAHVRIGVTLRDRSKKRAPRAGGLYRRQPSNVATR